MSTADPQARYRHVPLPTQQRRLRHLRSIAVRNITQKRNDSDKVDLSNTEVYFTLHKESASEAFYTSERIKGTLNPSWRGFNLEEIDETALQRQPTSAQTFFVLRVWHGLKDDMRLCIEWTVHLSGLTYLGEKSHRDTLHYPPNTVLFGIMDGIYSIPLSLPTWDPGKCYLEVEQSSVRSSYSTQTLLRTKTVLRAIKQTQASVQKIKNLIEGRLHRAVSLEDQRSRGRLQTVKNSLMHSDLDWRTSTLRLEKEGLEKERSDNKDREKKLKAQFKMLHDERAELHEKKKGYFDVREDLIKTGAQLVARRKDLIAELAFIYPIIEVNPDQYAICNVRLPNSEDFSGQDDVMISVALGYTCHLVEMISKFLDVPIRYPMEFVGSRSLIRDHVIDKLAERERNFPLFSKGREKFQFNYGVYLLNKNIAQLRFYCALSTNDLRLTLPNLKALLEFRLGVKFEAANAPVLAGQHMSVPPNLGGPQKSSNPMFGLSRRQSEGSTSSQTDSKSTETSKKGRRRSSSRSKSGRSDSASEAQSRQPNVLPVSLGSSGLSILSGSQTGLIQAPSETSNSSQTEEATEADESVFVSADVIASNHSNETNISPASEASCAEALAADVQSSVSNSQTESESPLSDTTPSEMEQFKESSPPSALDNSFIDDDLKSSSSDDENVRSTYNSRFKMWASDPSIPLGDDSSVDSANGLIVPSSLIPEAIMTKSGDTDKFEFPTSTFKTKAMTSPTNPVGPSGSCDDLLSKAETNDLDHPKVSTLSPISATGLVSRPSHCDKTDSDADPEDTATFVISGARGRQGLK